MPASRPLTPASQSSDHLPFNSQISEYGHIDDITPLLRVIDAQDDPTPTQEAKEDDEIVLGKRKIPSDISNTSTLVDEPPLKRKKKTKTTATADPTNKNEPYILASSVAVEECMKREGTPTGVALEIARLLTSKKIAYKDITPAKLASLKGTNAESGPQTARLFQPASNNGTAAPDSAFTQENAATSPWEELDKEETALSQDPYAGLGHSGLFPGWYGGKVNFTGKLKSPKTSRGNKASLEIALDRCSLGPSSRFARRFGSTSILRIRVDGDHLFNQDINLIEFFKRPFVLWGRVYRSFYAKESSIFLFRTNEGYLDGKICDNVFPGFSLLEFLHWHNPLDTNKKQGMPKWAARTALGLSNSFPGPLLLAENILDTPDVVAPDTAEDAPGRDMTDGCGYSNRSTHLQVYHMLGADSYPTAFQYRLAGIKGMSSERSDLPFSEPQKIWVRPSQIKIRYPENHHDPNDPTLRIIELVRTSHMKTPARLSAELIINLAENGVPHSVFTCLLQGQLKDIVESLTTWEGDDAMYKLWNCIERIGAVLYARRAREAAGEARAKGYGAGLEDDETRDDDDDDDVLLQANQGQRSTAWWPDHVSGCPSSLEETALVLLDAGFSPQSSPILREKLKQITKSRIRNTTQKVNWDLPQSATAFVVPDEFGVLEEDEIQIKSSRRNLLSDSGPTDVIVGDVLLSRNPCKLPTDVRKVKAVEHPALRDCVDVIVCSVKGRRRLLDFLAGGDYDGDKAMAIWATDFVQPFRNANEKHSLEPAGLASCFSAKDNIKAGEFSERISVLSTDNKIWEYQRYLLGALRNPAIIGLCSKMHDIAVYKHGYSNVRTVKLAHIFCKVLDGGKSGLELNKDTYEQYRKDYLNGTNGPAWKQDKSDKSPKNNESWLTNKVRKKQNLHRFVMDTLEEAAGNEEEKVLAEMDQVFQDLPRGLGGDPDLSRPWIEANMTINEGTEPSEITKAKMRDLAKIEAHVQATWKEHKLRVGKKFTDNHIEVRQDVLRALSKQFVSGPKLEDMETIMDEASISRLRASYAYIFDRKKKGGGWSRFPWNVALRELCHIKASALGPYKTTTIGFYERFKLSRR